jgi:hypothetical protein
VTYDVPRGEVGDAFTLARRGAARRDFDVLVVETLALPGLGVRRMLRELSALQAIAVDIASFTEPFVSVRGEVGRLVGWLHEHLEDERRQTIRAGLGRSSKRPGRPKKVLPAERILALDARGASLRRIAKLVGVGPSTVQRFLAAHRQTWQPVKDQVP